MLLPVFFSFGCGQTIEKNETSANTKTVTFNSSTNSQSTGTVKTPSPLTNLNPQNSSVEAAQKKKRDVSYFESIQFLNKKIGKTDKGEDGIVGEIKNAGNKTVNTLSIRAIFRNDEGRKIFETDFPVIYQSVSNADSSRPLKPNETRKFAFDIYDKSKISNNFELHVMEAETDK